jgi:hypothetical protein
MATLLSDGAREEDQDPRPEYGAPIGFEAILWQAANRQRKLQQHGHSPNRQDAAMMLVLQQAELLSESWST